MAEPERTEKDWALQRRLDDVFAKNHAAPASYRMDVQISETRYPRGVLATTKEPLVSMDIWQPSAQ